MLALMIAILVLVLMVLAMSVKIYLRASSLDAKATLIQDLLTRSIGLQVTINGHQSKMNQAIGDYIESQKVINEGISFLITRRTS